MCWLKYKGGNALASMVTRDSLLNGSFVRQYNDACVSQSEEYEICKLNHIWRVVTTMLIAWYFGP